MIFQHRSLPGEPGRIFFRHKLLSHQPVRAREAILVGLERLEQELELATIIEINPPIFLDVVLQMNNLKGRFLDVTNNDGGSPDKLSEISVMLVKGEESAGDDFVGERFGSISKSVTEDTMFDGTATRLTLATATLAARISRTDPCIERIEPHYWDACLTPITSSREHRHIVFIVDAVARRRRSV